MQGKPCVLFYLQILQFIDRIQIIRIPCIHPNGAFDMRALRSHRWAVCRGNRVFCSNFFERLWAVGVFRTKYQCLEFSSEFSEHSYIKGLIHYYTSPTTPPYLLLGYNFFFFAYVDPFFWLRRNHGESSSFNGMLGSAFTLKGGISSNLL